MHVIYKSIKAKSFNCTLGTMTKLKISVLKTVRPPLWKCSVADFLCEHGALSASVNNLLSLYPCYPSTRLGRQYTSHLKYK